MKPLLVKSTKTDNTTQAHLLTAHLFNTKKIQKNCRIFSKMERYLITLGIYTT